MSALVAAAAALPGLHAVPEASAQNMAEQAQFRFQYAYYKDWQGAGQDRISVRAPMAWLKTPVGESTEFEGSVVLDTISGASPLYHDTLTGASGIGIEDERFAGQAKVTEYFDDYSIGVNTSYSKEDDYESRGVAIDGRVWNENKSTTFAFGLSGNSDDISSTNNPDLDETSNTFGGLLGVTQVINKNSLLQSNLTFSRSSGYLSDPYKPGDIRPEERNRFAWLNRYVLYVPDLKGSFHLDYRHYRDSWGVNSHTFDSMWFQPIGEVWTLRPHVRFYSQSKADFFSNVFPDPTPGRAFSADQRLSGFGEITLGLKVIRDFGKDFSMHVGVDLVEQRGAWKIGSRGSPNIENFHEAILAFGFSKTF
ncbi:MAG: DUF3570 domain-containing protein [Bdellovibrionales bacterium]|nr:DUF3570 domain-containing protein [Bdellovibrionales bacterium]